MAEPMFRPPETAIVYTTKTDTRLLQRRISSSRFSSHVSVLRRAAVAYNVESASCGSSQCVSTGTLFILVHLVVHLVRHLGVQRSYFPSSSTLRLLVTENTPDTLLACISATCLSIWRATTPSRVTCPLLTTMWMGGTARSEYWLRTSFP